MPSDFQTILILGGTGSLGQALCQFLLDHTAATIRLFSRGELLQAQMEQTFHNNPRLRFLLGDVRDLARLNMACYGADLVIHAAALKRIDRGENDPSEFIATNIHGTENVIRACITMGVHRAVLISTDKAVSPINTYGATKLVAERLFQRANGYRPTGTAFVVTRYGNVAGSRGSIIPLWRTQLAAGQPLTVTSPQMSRFWMSLDDAVRLVWFAAQYGPRGAVLVPHLPAYGILALLEAVRGDNDKPFMLTGIRPGEKVAERLLNEDEGSRTLLYSHLPGAMDTYCVPPLAPSWPMPCWEQWDAPAGGVWEPWPVTQPYRSDVWGWKLTVEELRDRLSEVE